MAETMIASHVKSEPASNRKNKKPLMEKRRRARINSCLSQLKSLVLQAIKKDSSQFSKLEKADILELTVKHLRALQRQQAAGVMTQDPNVVGKYRAGFNECAKEVVRYMSSVREVNEDIKDRVLGHLSGCLQVVNHVTPVESMQQQQQQQQHHMKPLHVHIPSQQQPLTTGAAGLAGAAPSVAMMPAVQTSLHSSSALSFASPSPVRSTSSAASPDCQTPSPVASSTAPLSALPLMSMTSATTAASTVVTHNSSSSSPHHHPHHHQHHITGAFKIVPSSSCPSGAVALYLGGPPSSAAAVPAPLPTAHPHHPEAALTVDAVPLYSVSLPQAEGAVTAFVPPSSHPPPPSMPPASAHSQMVIDCRQSASASPDSASETYGSNNHHIHGGMVLAPSSSPSSSSSSSSPIAPSSSPSASASFPVDLRQSHKVKSFAQSSAVPSHHHHHAHHHHHPMSFSQCSPSSMSDEKLWRPW